MLSVKKKTGAQEAFSSATRRDRSEQTQSSNKKSSKSVCKRAYIVGNKPSLFASLKTDDGEVHWRSPLTHRRWSAPRTPGGRRGVSDVRQSLQKCC